MILNDYQDVVKAGVTPEQEVLTKHFCYFGPVPENLYLAVKDEKWSAALRLAATMAGAEVEDRPELRLRFWGQGLGEHAMVMLSGMTNLDLNARLTIGEVLALSY